MGRGLAGGSNATTVTVVTMVTMVVMLILPHQAPLGAVSIRDMLELSRAGLSDDLLEAVLEADPTRFDLDADTIVALREAGLSERVIVAMLRSGRTEPAPGARAERAPAEPLEVGPMLVVIGGSGATGGAGTGRRAGGDPHGHGIDADVPGRPVRSRVEELIVVPYPVPGLYLPYHSYPSAHRPSDLRPTLPRGGFGRFINDGFVSAPSPPAAPIEPVYWGWSGQRRPGSWDPTPSRR